MHRSAGEGVGLALMLAFAAIGVGVVGWATPKTTVNHAILFYIAGTLNTCTTCSNLNIYTPFSMTCTELHGVVNTAPTGASLIFSVKKNAGSVGSVTIPASSTTGSTSVSFSTVKNDAFTVDITQVGSTVHGSDLVVEIRCSQ